MCSKAMRSQDNPWKSQDSLHLCYFFTFISGGLTPFWSPATPSFQGLSKIGVSADWLFCFATGFALGLPFVDLTYHIYKPLAVPLFGTMPNGVSLPNHPNFLNQLAAAISTAASTTSVVGNPSSPPKQNQNKMAKPQQQPQGSAPMDLENENEHSADVSSTTAHKDPKMQATSSSLSLPDSAQLYLNGLMHTPPGYLYFPAAQAGGAPAPGNAPATGGGSTAAASGGSATNAQMLMDPTAMMAAAMQQMQQMHYAAAAAAGMTTEAGAGLEAALSAGKESNHIIPLRAPL